MGRFTEYQGPKVVFVDASQNAEALNALLADFQRVGIYAVTESHPFQETRCDLLLSVQETAHLHSPDILISTTAVAQKSLLYRCGCEGQRGRDFAGILEALNNWQQRQPLWACILIGGKSSRMGTPKHLITGFSKQTWLEEKVTLLEPFVDGVVLSGAGDIPRSLKQCPRVHDEKGVAGPMAGVVSTMRAYPHRSWLVCACDMPLVTVEAIEWLLQQRRFAQTAVIPKRESRKKGALRVHPEPLFAVYERECRQTMEVLVSSGERRIGKIAEDGQVSCPIIPFELQKFWSNINTPEDAESMRAE